MQFIATFFKIITGIVAFAVMLYLAIAVMKPQALQDSRDKKQSMPAALVSGTGAFITEKDGNAVVQKAQPKQTAKSSQRLKDVPQQQAQRKAKQQQQVAEQSRSTNSNKIATINATSNVNVEKSPYSTVSGIEKRPQSSKGFAIGTVNSPKEDDEADCKTTVPQLGDRPRPKHCESVK